ncbi:MAG: FkbM family methyltransferase [Cyanobacteriota bacterium]
MKKLSESLSQFLYHQLLNASLNTNFFKFKTRLFKNIFNKNLPFKEPLIQYNIAGFPLLVPISHQLPLILKLCPHYSSNLARMAKYVKQKYQDLKFIDIGANIGDSIAILRKEAEFPILCIEGDNQFLSVLEKNSALFSEIYIAKTYLGEFNKTIRGNILKEGGTAHLQEQEDYGEKPIIEVKKLSEVLKEYPLFSTSKMIKIDTDGFDGKILRGATDFLKSEKPVIFFEYDPFLLAEQGDDGISIFKDLREYSYQNMLIYDNFGDLIISMDVDNTRLLQEIHLYFSGRWGHRYCDICIFPTEDSDLFETVRQHEIQFFENIRGVK